MRRNGHESIGSGRMPVPRRTPFLPACLAAMLACGCGPKPVRTPEPPPAGDLIILLPDPESGTVGRAIVTNGAGSVELTEARASTTVSPNRAPAPPAVLSDADTQRLFGTVVASLPPAAAHFTVYFLFNSEELTPESAALLPQVLETVSNRPFPEVTVIGHTDTVGAAGTNVELGLRRAAMVRDRLVAAGLNPSFVEATSHGEADLLVSTGDNVNEPRNRRVEIIVQ
jgi:outer membrane protein OmpA-like peptidoglycan-associated protein